LETVGDGGKRNNVGWGLGSEKGSSNYGGGGIVKQTGGKKTSIEVKTNERTGFEALGVGEERGQQFN